MVAKCEIDSSAAKGVAPLLPPPPPEESSSVFPTFSSSEAIKTSVSTSTSSSGGGDGVGMLLEKKVVPPPSPAPDNVYPNKIGQEDQSSNIISTTISPSVASQILTSFHAPLAEQEVLGKMGDEVLKEQQQQHQPPRRENKFMNQFRDNNNNKQEASSSFSGASKRDKMSGIGTPVPVSTAETLVVPRAKGVSTTFSRNSERFSSSLSSFPGKPRESVFSRENVGEELISYNENNANSDYSPIPRHTWIPAGLTFSCKNRVPGYYADASAIAKCQVYHMCMTDGRKYTMLCGVGTVFNQLTFVCDHWYSYSCSEAESDYKINSQLWEDVIGDDESVEEEDDHDDNSDGSQNQENGSRNERVIEEDIGVHPISSQPPPKPFALTFGRISKSRSALS
ncbi:hypothetical protein Ocin01_08195 [Orchesella cincta]|uniref:Chitin-binding type-2 domain-containing protein n=1 Tax=Orchesella cincta TaxID=48709 RepID=A0A1D2MZR3_ORCCI|nr:hypothetical protein Ocin01_08195 [Orchesella cincta]